MKKRIRIKLDAVLVFDTDRPLLEELGRCPLAWALQAGLVDAGFPCTEAEPGAQRTITDLSIKEVSVVDHAVNITEVVSGKNGAERRTRRRV